MDTTTITCAACGNVATGKFCNSCGAPLTEQRCKGCGASLSPGARFCHMCGVPLAAPAAQTVRTGMAANAGWIVAGVALVALVVAVGSRFMSRPPQPSTPQFNSPATTSAMPAPDISQMTPRERADRLFERIMMADARGLTDTVAFFTPMALNAYAMLPETDIDAHYHVGLIQALAGNSAAVKANSDSIRADVPTHLMATMLDFAFHRLEGDSVSLRQTYREFLANYEDETAVGRPEYQAHETALDAFLADAQGMGSGGSE